MKIFIEVLYMFYYLTECDRKSSLDIIATEYGDTDSDMEEMEADSTTESEYIMSQMQTQNLQQYRTVEKNLSCEEIDSEDDSDSSSSSSSSSSNISISDNSSNSDSDDTTNIKYYYFSIQIKLKRIFNLFL